MGSSRKIKSGVVGTSVSLFDRVTVTIPQDTFRLRAESVPTPPPAKPASEQKAEADKLAGSLSPIYQTYLEKVAKPYLDKLSSKGLVKYNICGR